MAECLIHVNGGEGRLNKAGKGRVIKTLCGRWVNADIVVGEPETKAEAVVTCPRCEKRAAVGTDPAALAGALATVLAVTSARIREVFDGGVEVTRD